MKNFNEFEIKRMQEFLIELKSNCIDLGGNFSVSPMMKRYNLPLNTAKVLQIMGILAKENKVYKWNTSTVIEPKLARNVWSSCIKRRDAQVKAYNKLKDSDALRFNKALKEKVARLEKQVAEKEVSKENEELLKRIKELEEQLKH